MAKSLMIQGTASDSGKSILVAGLARLLYQDGFRVAPFKSQNMALNSYITSVGDEMGRAQVVQAEAAGIEPDVRMNPILLKPSSDHQSQVIFMGKILANMDARTYHDYKLELLPQIKEVYGQLAEEFDIVLIEGAGSPAEINLNQRDIVNMGMAKLADAPVLLVADIDKGGVFAAIYGTLALLSEEERERVKGVIINKFRGDVSLLQPGIDQIEALTQVPVVGVVPYLDLTIDSEDSLALLGKNRKRDDSKDLDIAVLALKRMSNFTDFQILEQEPDVSLRYVMPGDEIGLPDLLILPGSKNTLEDMLLLKETGRADEIIKAYENGASIFGICGGFQLLGETISDPLAMESTLQRVDGLGLLAIDTVMQDEKRTCQVLARQGDYDLRGYEIHLGESYRKPGTAAFATITDEAASPSVRRDGAVSLDGRVQGTYLHGIFDNSRWLRTYLNKIRVQKGLEVLEVPHIDWAEKKEREYDKLASALRSHLDMDRIYTIMGLEKRG